MEINQLDPKSILKPETTFEQISESSIKLQVKKTVLGLDIYKYSEYDTIPQIYIPVLFDLLYEGALDSCITNEKYFFHDYANNKTEFLKNFISTGDGGFQIFNNPLQAILFATYFQLNIKRYNSGGSTGTMTKKMSEFIHNIELRYAITIDDLYCYNDNFYGAAIINNSRILSKDNLNRLLIDENTVKWFDINLNSIENLSEVTKNDFESLPFFKNYNKEFKSTIFNKNAFKAIDVLKIGNIKAKSTDLKIYNLHIQAGLYSTREEGDTTYNYYKTTLGNLNTKGIE
jgi:hypothetical protein